MTPNPLPTIGRVVHIVLATGAHRPATVIHASEDDQPNVMVNLDATNDLNDKTPVFDSHGLFPESSRPFLRTAYLAQLDSVPYDETGTLPGTWHWPERT
ncbi:hypothetical protein [Deinococcus sp. Leaf326]|uniref:hypothetical protein n=1 Tax=Deinococcus sp. Leaf326 TaxID=1736338 RepID=UPI0006FB0793|nr:hypothetical protein [Deinococcus sp. Leaf326]KQR37775.1 hypothetical protein ASF71_14940 [Deinococcus sp. Leaf326]